jgi:hypothetical protein
MEELGSVLRCLAIGANDRLLRPLPVELVPADAGLACEADRLRRHIIEDGLSPGDRLPGARQARRASGVDVRPQVKGDGARG